MPHKEKEFVIDHSNLFVNESWYQKMDADAWCGFVGVMLDSDPDCVSGSGSKLLLCNNSCFQCLLQSRIAIGIFPVRPSGMWSQEIIPHTSRLQR